MALLEVDNVSRRFGGILALDELSLTVEKDEIAGLIGPNGAGKTTAFNVITRLYKPSGGAVRYEGKDLLREPAHRIIRLGIARTFQNLQLCAHMSVLDNVLVGAHSRIAPRLRPHRARRSHSRSSTRSGSRSLRRRPRPDCRSGR